MGNESSKPEQGYDEEVGLRDRLRGWRNKLLGRNEPPTAVRLTKLRQSHPECYIARTNDVLPKLSNLRVIKAPVSRDWALQKKRTLGTGFSGAVVLAENRDTGQRAAVKGFSKTKLGDQRRLDMLRDEINVYLSLDHPNVCKLLYAYEDRNHVWLVMELCAEELYDRLCTVGVYTELEASEALSQMFLAVNYLHSYNIVHRDLKLENWMYAVRPSAAKRAPNVASSSTTSSSSSSSSSGARNGGSGSSAEQSRGHREGGATTGGGASSANTAGRAGAGAAGAATASNSSSSPQTHQRLKLIDFGFSKKLRRADDILELPCGTLHYASPDVLRRSYTSKCDLWSMGVICFMLLTGSPPFTGSSNQSVIERIRAGRIRFNSRWAKLSKTAQHFTLALLDADAERRLSGRKALQHDFLRRQFHRYSIRHFVELQPRTAPAAVCSSSSGSSGNKINLVENMRNFANGSRLMRAGLLMLAYRLSSEDTAELMELFFLMDRSGRGTLRLDDFAAILRRVEPDIESDEVEDLFCSLAADRREVFFSQFVAAMLQRHCCGTLGEQHGDQLKQVFDTLAYRKDGQLSHEQLREVLLSDADGMIAEAAGTGTLDYQEFLAVICQERKVPPPRSSIAATTSRGSGSCNLATSSEAVRTATGSRTSLFALPAAEGAGANFEGDAPSSSSTGETESSGDKIVTGTDLMPFSSKRCVPVPCSDAENEISMEQSAESSAVGGLSRLTSPAEGSGCASRLTSPVDDVYPPAGSDDVYPPREGSRELEFSASGGDAGECFSSGAFAAPQNSSKPSRGSDSVVRRMARLSASEEENADPRRRTTAWEGLQRVSSFARVTHNRASCAAGADEEAAAANEQARELRRGTTFQIQTNDFSQGNKLATTTSSCAAGSTGVGTPSTDATETASHSSNSSGPVTPVEEQEFNTSTVDHGRTTTSSGSGRKTGFSFHPRPREDDHVANSSTAGTSRISKDLRDALHLDGRRTTAVSGANALAENPFAEQELVSRLSSLVKRISSTALNTQAEKAERTLPSASVVGGEDTEYQQALLSKLSPSATGLCLSATHSSDAVQAGSSSSSSSASDGSASPSSAHHAVAGASEYRSSPLSESRGTRSTSPAALTPDDQESTGTSSPGGAGGKKSGSGSSSSSRRNNPYRRYKKVAALIRGGGGGENKRDEMSKVLETCMLPRLRSGSVPARGAGLVTVPTRRSVCELVKADQLQDDEVQDDEDHRLGA